MKYGRIHKPLNPKLPHYDRLKMRVAALPAPPKIVSNLGAVPTSTGVMLNDQLGCCTCSAAGHAEQVWTSIANPPMATPPDSAVLALYEAMGFVVGNPKTDQGASCEDVLTYWLNHGFNGKKLLAFFPVDVTNVIDIQRVIWECGLVYWGANIPAWFGPSQEMPGAIWDVRPTADNTIVDGHCAITVASNMVNGVKEFESWGSTEYTMTQAWWDKFVVEAWALVHPDWVEATGLTPLGLAPSTLMGMMSSVGLTSISPPTSVLLS